MTITNLSIRVLLTPSASHFLAGQSTEQPTVTSLAALPNVDGVYGDTPEWREPWKVGNAILRIELRRWVDILVIAPLSANTLTKIVNGMAGSILPSVVRAWDARGELDSNVLAQPGGNSGEVAGAEVPGEEEASSSSTAGASSQMLTTGGSQAEGGTDSSETDPRPGGRMGRRTTEGESECGRRRGASQQRHYGGGDEDDDHEGEGWFEVVRPQSKLLACNDRGDGAMCEWIEIVRVIEDHLRLNG
ncbi:hypothetical protein DL764_003081 [Monosporascus ibericus]|uniref:Flavoprotein domain-containing protein n=1 Tax=Monosporascus ibericus TaxID=155417 RepID=A0A4Q4TJR2_9PEZI|nr:hypothetical protein DL764_003081 [Monosporascus ibericus]